METPITTPEDLVNEWKRSGGLDLARKSILNEFMSSSDKATLLTRLDSIITTTLTSSKFKQSTTSSTTKKEKHTLLMKAVEPHCSISSPTLKSVEKVIIEGEKDSDERKERGMKRKRGRVHLGRELERLLRESRGEVVSDDEEEEEEEEMPTVEEEVQVEKEDVEMKKASTSPVQPLLFGGRLATTGGLQFSGSLQFGNPSPKKATLFSSSSAITSTPTLFGTLPIAPVKVEQVEQVASEMN